jgi:predicted  nucleic acid-binding Zn-ribbon protein
MAKTNSSSNGNNLQEIEQLRNQVEWLDQERRKANRKLAEMEQQFTLQGREISGREQRIKELEKQLAAITAQIARIPQIDVKLGQFKDEMVQMIDQYDQRRVKANEEQERVRRVEYESTARELGDIRKELPAIGRLAQDMELRQAEEARLANLIGQQKNQVGSLGNQLEETQRSLSFVEEKEKQNSRAVADLQNSIIDINKRWAPFNDRLDVLASKVARLETTYQAIQERQDKVEDSVKSWMEQVQVGEHERNKKLEKWRSFLDEQTQTMDQFRKEWITFSDQYKEAKMAVDTLGGWQRQIEQQQQEATEIMRIDSHRMQSRWDNFTQENEKRWRNQEMDMEQRWQNIARQEKQIQEHIQELEGYLKELEQEKDRLQRVQNAQSDAIKKIPLIWLEEVEKAVAQDPNRRRAAPLVPVREE